MIIAIDARPLVTRQIGGAEQRARNIVSAWIKQRPEHEFHLIYTRGIPAPGAAGADEHYDDSLLTNLPDNFHRVEISSYQFPSRFHMGTRVLNALSRSLGRTRADVYHAFTPYAPRTAVCPVVPTIHDLSFELDPVVRETAEGRELRVLTAKTMRFAERLIAVSSQTKYDIASIYRLSPDRIDVVYNGIDPAFAPPSPTDLFKPAPVHIRNNITGQYVLAVGADIPRRNYPRMLDAMRAVWAGGSKAKWVLAGRDDWKISDIYAAARAAGVLDRMRFVAAPTNAELADLYRGATITCCASSFEGFGLSVLESMACGTAAACSDMRSLREVAEDAAVYFSHDDAEAMGEAIGGLLDDAEYRRQLKYRGLRRAQMFTWATAAQLTLASLESVVKNRSYGLFGTPRK
ncbi:MAG TPA: glycosyltransferase family 1 protein [Phycisphaerae bacterium]|nr:glycosyltransferase family 1 protein [Phycisphaerae bacterium]